MNTSTLLTEIIAIARQAGDALSNMFGQAHTYNVQYKADASPVTAADLKAHEIICQRLTLLTPEIPILSEENADISYAVRRKWKTYWLIDPLDGTRQFIQGKKDFTVNIALIENYRSVMGVIVAPMLGLCYYASLEQGAFKLTHDSPLAIKISKAAQDRIRIIISNRNREQLKHFTTAFADFELMTLASSLKFCLIAEGKADIYPRFGTTCEWDVAAGHCILECAGGKILDPQQQPLRYNTKASLHNPKFIAFGDGDPKWAKLLKK